MEVAVKDIVVIDRIRNDYGDIEELAKDISEHGLICPLAVTQDLRLIAGERRLRAIRSLGWDVVEVNVMNVEDEVDVLEREISENEARKDFTFSERMEYVKRLKPRYQEIAAQNSKAGTTATGVAVGRVNDIVAEKIGFGSGNTLRKAERIIESGSPEMIQAVDDGSLSINGAYEKLQKELEEAKKATKLAEQEAERLLKANRIFESQELETSEQFDQMDLKIREQQETIQKLENNKEKVQHEVLTVQEPIAPQRALKICDMISTLIEPLLEAPTSMYKAWEDEQKQEIFRSLQQLLENMQDIESVIANA